ncbi:MAG: glycosyltransferase family 4 protein [Gemmataceae bacterium]
MRSRPASEPAGPTVPEAVIRPPRLLFASAHCLLDPSSGAALATRDLLALLAARGWACGAVTGPRLDFDRPPDLPVLLRRFGPAVDTRAGAGVAVHHLVHRGVPVSVVEPAGDDPGGFAAALGRVTAAFRPDVVLTYGGGPYATVVTAAARAANARVAFAVHNFAYPDRAFFRPYDAVLVPSEYARTHYRDRVGVEAVAAPPVWDWDRTACDPSDGRFVTLVNPRPEKGVFVFARLAAELAARRPDIPLLVVQGRGDVDWLGRAGVDLSHVRSVHRMANVPDPRAYLRLTRVLVAPSLWRESFCRAAAEAMQNGIPVVASTRGALPETVGGAGVLLDIPDRYTSQTRVAPTAAEVAPWVDAVERLCTEPSRHDAVGGRCRVAARRWHPDVVVPVYEAVFRAAAGGLATGNSG